MKKINLDKIIYVFILIIMIGIPALKFLTYVPFIYNISPGFILVSRVCFFWSTIIFLLVIYLYSIFSKERKINYIDYLFYFLIFSLFITTIFSTDIRKSFLGENLRYDGLLTILNYYLLALNAKNIISEKYKKNIIKCFIILGIIQVIYALLQSFTPLTYFVRKFSISPHMAMGLCGNPNFFGAYMAMLLSIITIYFIKNGTMKYLIVYILFSIGLYLSSSSGPFLGYILSFILFGFLLKKNYKRIFCLLFVFIIVCFSTDSLLKYVHVDVYNNNDYDRYVISSDISNTFDEISSNDIESVGSGRVDLWLNTLPLVKKYWLVGCGLDNFGDVYLSKDNIYYDKAHNIYLQMAVTNGIFPLIIYLILCLIIFLKGFMLKETYSVALFMAFVSYCILAFTNISIMDVSIYFYIIVGLLLSLVDEFKFKVFVNKK